jgi:hypothetical protein
MWDVGHHPSEELLLRFVRGETTRAETRAVVRHLLTGCRECRAVTSSAWGIEAFAPALSEGGTKK